MAESNYYWRKAGEVERPVHFIDAVCRYYSNFGYCRNGDQCSFFHKHPDHRMGWKSYPKHKLIPKAGIDKDVQIQFLLKRIQGLEEALERVENEKQYAYDQLLKFASSGVSHHMQKVNYNVNTRMTQLESFSITSHPALDLDLQCEFANLLKKNRDLVEELQNMKKTLKSSNSNLENPPSRKPVWTQHSVPDLKGKENKNGASVNVGIPKDFKFPTFDAMLSCDCEGWRGHPEKELATGTTDTERELFNLCDKMENLLASTDESGDKSIDEVVTEEHFGKKAFSSNKN